MRLFNPLFPHFTTAAENGLRSLKFVISTLIVTDDSLTSVPAPATVVSALAQNRLKPSSTVPFPKDDMFVGREEILEDIRLRHEHAASQNHVHSRVALVGLGGVG